MSDHAFTSGRSLIRPTGSVNYPTDLGKLRQTYGTSPTQALVPIVWCVCMRACVPFRKGWSLISRPQNNNQGPGMNHQ